MCALSKKLGQAVLPQAVRCSSLTMNRFMKNSFFLCLCILSTFTFQARERENTYDVRSYGAVGDGKHLDSPAINKAAAAWGGTDLVPAPTCPLKCL